MKLVLFLSFLLAGMVHAVHAQSLDIGGIELRLGQRADEALRSLSSYQVKYIGSSWLVSQKIANQYQILGSFGATANTISFISKSFDMEKNERAAETYTQAYKELRRRGGASCSTREVEYSDGLIRSFDTQCGSYILSYFMPSETGDGIPVLGYISMIVRAK